MGFLVFSAHAEVVPLLTPHGISLKSILRARGGSSIDGYAHAVSLKVFSAHAEVVPTAAIAKPSAMSILRARGGSSLESIEQKSVRLYSPRTRR